jgi:hypothetical protein
MADEKNLNEIYETMEMNWEEGTEAQNAEYWMFNFDDETLNKIKKEGMDFTEEWFKKKNSSKRLRDDGTYEYDKSEYLFIKFYKALSFLLFGYRESGEVTGFRWIGNENTTDGDSTHPSLIENAELPDVIKALESINVEELEKNFDPKEFRKGKIYPYIWDLYTKEEWFKALISKYYGLLDFYRKARDKKAHVIIGTFGVDECENYDGDCSNCEYAHPCHLLGMLTEDSDDEEGEVYGTVL